MFSLSVIAALASAAALYLYVSGPSTENNARDTYIPPCPAPSPDVRRTTAYRGRVFTVETSEGEVCRVDTSDASSPFYGPAWTRVLTARENGEFLRGRARTRLISREGRFSGYLVNVEGVNAFLPASKAAWFYDPERDACGKSIALGVENVYTSGKKAGTLVVSAYAPVRYLNRRQARKGCQPGGTSFAIAMDYDDASLIFPQYGDRIICAPLQEAVSLASDKGIDPRPSALTGYCWQLKIMGWKGNMGVASPIDVLSD